MTTVELHAGYVGAFTRDEAEGALRNGRSTRP
jgi:hypothetical protein